MEGTLKEALECCPVVAAVKDTEGLEKSLGSECTIIFVLFGDVCGIPSIVDKIKESGKLALVHIDLIVGLSGKEAAVDYIRQSTRADGIITTKPALVKRARELGLCSILRFFVIDSMALENIERQVRQARPDVVEMLPGIIAPKIISRICRSLRVPVIAGGLISEKEDIMAALEAGAVSISTTNEKVWFM